MGSLANGLAGVENFEGQLAVLESKLDSDRQNNFSSLGTEQGIANCLSKRGGAESANRADHTDHFIGLSDRSGRLYGLYHCQRDVNTPNEGKCLVEFFSRPPSASYRPQFHRICMKTGPEYL